MKDAQETTLDWQGITIHIRYTPDFSPSFREHYGHSVALLEVKAPCPLPITETGYRSVWPDPAEVTASGGPGRYVQEWLEAILHSPEGKDWQAAHCQMSLF